jgi:hypothetical protein
MRLLPLTFADTHICLQLCVPEASELWYAAAVPVVQVVAEINPMTHCSAPGAPEARLRAMLRRIAS